MDLRTSVYNAAASGNLDQLKKYLDGKTSSEIEDIICSLTDGATPLIVACRNSSFDVAHFLIMECHADINQSGSVTFQGVTTKEASALWCATAAGNIQLVKLLISQGADVDYSSESNSTPLRTACLDGHVDIVTFLIQHGADIEIADTDGRTNLMIACSRSYSLIVKCLLACGADVNRKTVKGRTALHECAQSGSVEVLEMLLNYGAKFEPDSCGTTPVLYAAISGNAVVVEHFIQNFPLSNLDKINALEMMGAADIDMRRNIYSGLACWRRAMNMRYEDPESLFLKADSETPFGEYIQTSEVNSLAQLEELRSDPDELRMQALLVRKRILGLTHPHTFSVLRLLGDVYTKNGNFAKGIKLWTYALDFLQKSSDPVGIMTQVILISFVELFTFKLTETEAPQKNVLFRQMLDVFQRSLEVLEGAMEMSRSVNGCDDTGVHFHRTLSVVMHEIELMCRLVPVLTSTEVSELKQEVYKFVQMNPRGKNNCTPLHLACSEGACVGYRHFVCRFPSRAVAELLLEVGANPNAVDVDSNSPLHVVALVKPCPMDVIKTLLSHGAHLDLSNIQKMSPLQSIQNTPLSYLYPLQYINLQCLCAQTVRSHSLPYKGLVQKSLEKFLDVH